MTTAAPRRVLVLLPPQAPGDSAEALLSAAAALAQQSGADRLSFTDPEWADNIAKAVYRAIAQVYGTR